MKRKTSLLILGLTATGFTSIPVLAAEQSGEITLGVVPEEIISSTILNEIELGIGYISDDAYKFGRYNGMESDGVFAVGDIKVRIFEENGGFWNFRATNLGLESRYLLVEAGSQGENKFFLEYDELPNYKNNTVETPFAGIGSEALSLPSGYDPDNISSDDFSLFELKTKREKLKLGAIFTPAKRWQFDIDFSHSNKQGVDATGAAIATNTTQVIGSTTTSLIPEPIDQDTNIANATISYATKKAQADLKYHVSLFNNNYNSLSWDNPLPIPVDHVATGTRPDSGSMSLAPDNEFHQLSLTGAYTLPYKSRLTGFLSMGRMTQNQNFQPYTTNSSVPAAALPADSLDGEVWLKNVQLKLSSRPVNKLRLNAELLYKERDNQTPVNTYSYVRLDSHNTVSVENRPYSYENSRINLLANYRINAMSSVRGGYKFNEMKRDYTDAEREKTDESTFFAKWKVKVHSNLDFSLLGETSSRDGSDYITPTGENPAMRKYHLADRSKDKVAATVDIMATDKLFMSAKAEYNQVEYDDSTIGLIDSSQPVYTVDFTYQPTNNISTYGYFTNETLESNQVGKDVSPSATVLWEADFKDTFNTIGFGATLNNLGKWSTGANITYSDSTGEIDMTDIVVPGSEIQFPDTKTKLSSIQLWGLYQYSKQLSYKLGYIYEKYSADNWAVDNLQAYDPAYESLLLLDNETLDYNVYTVTLSAVYTF